MRKLRFATRLTFAFIWRFKGVMLGSIVVGLSGFLLLKFISLVFTSYATERIAIIGRFHPTDLPIKTQQEISSGLTKISVDGTALPALASSWEESDGGQKWTFHLGSHKWQNGSEVTSEGINYSFEDVQIEKPDSKTIVFMLKTPYAAFPIVVAKPVFKKGLLGTGAWSVSRLSLAGPYVETLTLLQIEEKKERIIKFYPTEERAKLAFKLGEVDLIEDVIDPKPLDGWNVLDMQSSTNEQRFAAVFFNVSDGILAEKDLRRALSYALDRSKFEGTRALGPISQNSWAYNSQVKPYDYDPERAKELITGLASEVKSNLTIRLSTTPLLLGTAEKIAKDWEAIGVKTTVAVTTVLPNEYQAFLALYDIPNDPDQYATWHSTQTETNISKYKSPRIDKLLENGRAEIDLEIRKKIYLDFQRFLLEDAPAVFLYHPISYTITRK